MVPRWTNLPGVQISWQKWFIVFILAVGSIMVGTALTRLHWCQRYLSRGANSCFVMELIFDAVFIGLIIAYFTAHSEIMNSLLILLSVRSSNWHCKSIFLWRIHSAWLWLRSISQSAIVQPLWLLWWWRKHTERETAASVRFGMGTCKRHLFWMGRDLHKRVLQFSTMGTFDAKFPSVCQSLSVSHFPSLLPLLFISNSFVLSLSPNSLVSMFQLSSPFLKG